MIYEFRCRSCHRRFDVEATLAEKERGLAPTCPACGGADVQRVFGRVLFLRSGGDPGSSSGDDDFGGGGLGDDGFDGSDDDFGDDDLGGGSGCGCGGACSCGTH